MDVEDGEFDEEIEYYKEQILENALFNIDLELDLSAMFWERTIVLQGDSSYVWSEYNFENVNIEKVCPPKVPTKRNLENGLTGYVSDKTIVFAA